MPRPVTDLSSDGGSFVLLAGGGAGKTTVLDWLSDQEAGGLSVDLLGLDRSGMREALEEAVRTAPSVYVDALDEVMLSEPTAVHVLRRVITAAESRGTAWRLGCRPASWPSVLADALRGPGFHELRLLPLTRTAACDAIADLVPDPDRFIEAVVSASLGRLSASPMQLRDAARRWRETGQLPGSHVESISFEVRRLLTEGSSSREPDLPVDRRYRLAGRLAAISVFSGVAQYSRTATSVPRAMAIADLPSSPEGDEPGTPITPGGYVTVLGTALFEAAPQATVAFRHQQYAEYLAAEYLSRRRVTRLQVTQLLGISDGVVPGPMAGVAAWLVAVAPELVDNHIAANPIALLQTDVELPTRARVEVVEGLMAKAAAGDIDAEWGLDLSGLAHPGLEEQIREHLSAGLHEHVEVWWLSRLALAGQCRGLVKEFVGVAIDSRWYAWARRAAIAVIKELGDDDDRRALRPLLSLDVQQDPDDELFAGAIDALYPDLLTTDQLLAVLRPQRNTHLVGAYRFLLGELAERIPLPDLPIVLSWVSERARGGRIDREYGRLAGQLVARGWDQAQRPAVRDGLAALLGALSGPSSQSLGVYHEKLPWVERPDVEQRRQLAIATASLVGDRWYQLVRLGILVGDDFEWLIGELPELPIEARQTLAVCAARLLDEPTSAQIDSVLSLDPSHPAYEATRWWRDPIALDSEAATRMRQSWQAEQEAREEEATVGRNWRAALAGAITRTSDDVTMWWQVAYLLAGYDETPDKHFSHDLTRRPGWTHLDTDEQQLVLDLGVQYLAEHIPQPSNCLGRKNVSLAQGDTAIPDWSGVYLLTTLARHNRGRVAELSPTIWEAWAPAIVGAWNYDSEEDARLRCDLFDLAPTQARERILDVALEHLELLAANDETLSPRHLYVHLCKELAPRLASRIIEGHYGARLGAELIELLGEHEPTTALAVCRAISAGSPQHTVARRKLAELEPEAAVDSLISGGHTDDEVAVIASRIRLDTLGDTRIAALGRLLLDRFPLDSDPPMQGGFRSDGPAFEARQIRNRTLQLLADRGAADALQDLSDGRPDLDRQVIGFHIRAARTRAADQRLVQPSPDELLAMVSRADARLVRHSDDLLRVVLEQLADVQHQIRTGSYRYLWNVPRDGEPRPKSEDDITDWLRNELQHRMGRGSALYREVQVERPETGGIGTRIDLTLTLPTATTPTDAPRVIVEAKLISNRSLRTAMTDQLVRQYLEPTGIRHGIYLVYWVDPAQRPSGWTNSNLTDQAGLQRDLEQEATTHQEQGRIVPFVLDISRQQPG